MAQDPRLQALLNIFDTLFLVLERPVVQRQLLAFVLVVLVAWYLPHLLSRILARLAPAKPRAPAASRWRRWQRRILRWAQAVQYTFFPLLGLLLGRLTIDFFDANGWRNGLIELLLPLFWLLLAYRILAGLLHAVLTPENARLYNRRFLGPVFLILVLGILSSRLSGTFPIGEIELINLLETPITLTSLFRAAVVLYLFIALAWISRDLLNRYLASRPDADMGAASTIMIVSYYTIVGLGILTSLSALGFNLSALTIIFGGLSVGIGFGLQELVANFISGILLLFEQSLRPGDVIEVSGQRGTVNQLRMRATVLRTIDNVEIFVPNKTLLTSSVSTYTHTDRIVRRIIPVGVSYSSDPTQVRDILLRIAQNHGLVLKNPEPVVYFTNFGESSLDFELAVWVESQNMLNVLSDLRFMIWREFEKNQIEIPFPQRDLHLRSGIPWEALAGKRPQEAPPLDGEEEQTGPAKPKLPKDTKPELSQGGQKRGGSDAPAGKPAEAETRPTPP